MHNWPHLKGVIMDPYFFDHYPVRITFEIMQETGKPFEFFNYLTDNQGFMQAMKANT